MDSSSKVLTLTADVRETQRSTWRTRMTDCEDGSMKTNKREVEKVEMNDLALLVTELTWGNA